MKEKDVFILEILVVILLSLGFERFKTWLDNKFHRMGTRGKKMMMMKESLFSEIMTLGFIGLLVFISTKSGEAHYLGKQLFFGDEEMLEEEEPLSETFEIVHMIIFCIMVTFVLQCSILMWRASNESNKWEMWEHLRVKGDAREKDAINSPISLDALLLKKGYLKLTDSGNYVSARPLVYTNPWYKVLQSSSGLKDLITWRAVRHEFLFPSVNVTSGRHHLSCIPTIPDNDNDNSRGELESWGRIRNHVRAVESPQYFSFHQYLEEGLGDIFVELVEVDMKTWVVAALFCPFLHIAMEMDSVHLHTLITVMSWTWVFLTFLFGMHIYNVYHEVSPELPTDPKSILEVFAGTSTHSLKSRGRSSAAMVQRTKSKSSIDSGIAELFSPYLSPKVTGDSPREMVVSPSADSIPGLGVDVDAKLSEPLLRKLDEDLRQQSRLNEATTSGLCGMEQDMEMQQPLFSPSSRGQTINSPLGSDIGFNASDFQLIKRLPARFRLKEGQLLSRPWYLRIMIWCGILSKTSVPDDQQRLFLFHEWSKEFYSFFLEVIMFFQAITTSMYLVIWFSSREAWTPAQWVCFVAGVVAPFFNLICLVPRIVSKMCITLMIEYHKDEEMIQSVIFSCKKQQLLESLKLLKIAKLKGRMSRLSDKNGKLTAKIFEGTKERFNHLSEKKQKDISKVFHLFDSDCSGTISKDEMILVLNTMNMDQNSEAGEHAMELMNLVDFDNSGSLQEDEFKVLMCLALYHSGPEEERLDLEKLFQEFDQDKSGKVSVRELSDYFADLGVSLNEDDMAQLIFSIFKSSKQQLDIDHFMYFLHKLEDMAEKS